MLTEWMSATWLRVKALAKRRQLDRDLEDELQFHLAMREEKIKSDEALHENDSARRAPGMAYGKKLLCNRTPAALILSPGRGYRF